MNENSLKFAGIALVLLACASAAQADLELLDGKVWFTGEERLRIEYRENNVTFNDSVDKDTDLWFLNRVRLGAGAKPVDWFTIFGELQDAREWDSKRFPTDVNLEEDELDWRQGWIQLGLIEEFPFGLKIGRQVLSYGDERLIGGFDWNNVGRVFDAAKLRWQEEKFWIDLFGANVVRNTVATGREDSFDDRSEWADDFFGLYAQTTLCPFQSIEVYVLLRDKDDAVYDGPAREIWTIGTRVKSSEKVLPFDYYAEIAGQVGEVDAPGVGAPRFGEPSSKKGVDHYALAAVAGGGFTFTNCYARPRIGLEYNYASGDERSDGENNTFDNLFPTNHKFFGYMDLFAWKNIHSPRATVSAAPHKRVNVQIDYHLFWLAEDEDYWYRANQVAVGVPARLDTKDPRSSFVGSEFDLTVTWNACKYAKLLAGYSHFFAGDFLNATKGGSNGTDDADFLYLQATLGF